MIKGNFKSCLHLNLYWKKNLGYGTYISIAWFQPPCHQHSQQVHLFYISLTLSSPCVAAGRCLPILANEKDGSKCGNGAMNVVPWNSLLLMWYPWGWGVFFSSCYPPPHHCLHYAIANVRSTVCTIHGGMAWFLDDTIFLYLRITRIRRQICLKRTNYRKKS
jgi:hypothetical protein